MKGFLSKRVALKVDVFQVRKIYCLQARPCIFQPGNFTGLGNERVNMIKFTFTFVNIDIDPGKAVAYNRRTTDIHISIKTNKRVCKYIYMQGTHFISINLVKIIDLETIT